MIQFKVDSERCNQCEECVRDCPRAIIEMKEGLPTIAADKEEMCIGCQHCLTICKPGAISILGKNPDESTLLKGNLPSPEQMETLIRGRRSTRRYKNKSVDPATISHLLEVTANAPTGVNNMGTLFTVVDDLAVMDKIRRDSYVSLEGHVDAGTLP
ncbi:MAG: nitroreductase family protein, partial [Proteobacteria bacterium]|nr:nitroreductase family protein [Pseudomonadota bacterium]MBU1611885.1 nitroreductase family protein [Pseudomonadota bacterium]